MFVLNGTDKRGLPLFTFKLDPAFGNYLRSEYKDIILGYYMNKIHWNSLYLKGNVPDETVQKMADMSYQLILNSLSKKAQKQIDSL